MKSTKASILIWFLSWLLPGTMRAFQEAAIRDYLDLSNKDLLQMARQGTSFYIQGDTEKNGEHMLYKFVPVARGMHKTVLLRPDSVEKVIWKDGERIEPAITWESTDEPHN